MIDKLFKKLTKNSVRVKKSDMMEVYFPEHKKTFEAALLCVWDHYYHPGHLVCVSFDTEAKAWDFIENPDSDKYLKEPAPRQNITYKRNK